jgi:hypothetical protein
MNNETLDFPFGKSILIISRITFTEQSCSHEINTASSVQHFSAFDIEQFTAGKNNLFQISPRTQTSVKLCFFNRFFRINEINENDREYLVLSTF